MKIEQLTVGFLQEHAYFVVDEITKHGFIIDPGAEADVILKKVEKEGLIIEKILLTHGHFDHIGAVSKIREALGCKVVAHERGVDYLENADWNLSGMFGGDRITLQADCYVKHGDKIVLEANPEITFEVIHIPGHTTDGVAYYNEKNNVAIVGDIIFDGSVGRTDNPGGDMGMLLKYIPQRLFVLPEETVLYCGHGAMTTIKKEKHTNPFFNMYS